MALGFLTASLAGCGLETPNRPGKDTPSHRPPAGRSESEAPPHSGVVRFHGLSDASTAIALDPSRFLVADDETNALQLYDADAPSAPIEIINLETLTGLSAGGKEADFEGSARVGDVLYWITSHGRDKKGDWEPARHRFVGTRLTREKPLLQSFGRPYSGLAKALARDPRLKTLGVDRSIQWDDPEDKDLAPKDEGLNIEGLAPMPRGEGLWIGMRNPRPAQGGRAMALAVPFLNPQATLTEERNAELGDPVLWDLDGLGIRSLHYDQNRECYWIVAGPHSSDDAPFHLYRWTGQRSRPPRRVWSDLHERAPRFTPEAILTWPGREGLLLLSDDGSIEVEAERDEVEPGEWKDGRAEQKRLLNLNRRTFKGVWIAP